MTHIFILVSHSAFISLIWSLLDVEAIKCNTLKILWLKIQGLKVKRTVELIKTTAKIVNSTFVSNRKGSYRKFAVFDGYSTYDGFIGGAIIATNSTNITISQSKLEDNGAEYGGASICRQQHR